MGLFSNVLGIVCPPCGNALAAVQNTLTFAGDVIEISGNIFKCQMELKKLMMNVIWILKMV